MQLVGCRAACGQGGEEQCQERQSAPSGGEVQGGLGQVDTIEQSQEISYTRQRSPTLANQWCRCLIGVEAT